MNILLIDKNANDRESVRKTITEQVPTFDLIEAATPIEGIAALNANRFDIVLIDHMMSVPSGIEMMKQIRTMPNTSNTAIVFISASNDESIALNCLAAGAQGFVSKDEISSAKLVRAIFQAQKRFELEGKLNESNCRVLQTAEKDILTGLANRCSFERILNSNMQQSSNSKHKSALLLLDLDHFKKINDTFGHETGDEFLKVVVKKIANCLRAGETFARLGGDEFAIIINQLDLGREVELVARRIVKALEKPILVKGNVMQSGVSIGIAVHPLNANTSEQLVQFADIAMYQAKKLGRSQFCFFEDNMQQQFSRSVQIELELKQAVKDDRFVLHYQPIIEGGEQHLCGFEALIRWPSCYHQSFPDEFIPIAEQSNLINELGHWVIDEAVKQLSIWQKKFQRKMTMSINLSPVQLADSTLADYVKTIVNKYDVNAEHVILEITETALLHNNQLTSQTITELDKLGCKLALDDFGTGYSSLSHLVNYPIDIVKLDKSMLPETPDNVRHMSIVRGMAAMAQIVGLNVIVEGVETAFHYLLCKDFGIQKYQGNFFGKPESVDTIEGRWLETINHSVEPCLDIC